MINNGRAVQCPTCGGKALETVHADGFDDAPETFTFRVQCERGCPKQYANMTAQQMHERTRLPLSGWSETRY